MIKLKSLISKNVTKKRYSAIELDDKSKNLLLNKFRDKIPNNWNTICHHMTIDPFNTLPEDETGKEVRLKVTHIGKSDKAIAAKVSGYQGKTNNKFPHVTIAIDRNNGAKPKDSNEIMEWEPIQEDIYLNGTIRNL